MNRYRRHRGASWDGSQCGSLAVVLVCALAVMLSLGCAPALALIHRGHVFGFDIEGEGPHAFGSTPSGVAVNEATGEVYVAGPVQERVQRFKPKAGGGYEFVSEFAAVAPSAIAIDNAAGSPSKGDVYVVVGKTKAEPEERELHKYEADGETIYKSDAFKVEGEKGETEELEDITGIGVDAGGRLWVDYEEEGSVAGLSDAEHDRLIPALRVEDALERLYEDLGVEPCPARPGFAVGPHDEAFYLGHERVDGLEACAEEATRPTSVAKFSGSEAAGIGSALAASVDDASATGVAVDDGNGDVYVDNGSSVSVFTSGGRLVQSFGMGELSGAGAIAVDGATEQVFVAEAHKLVVFEPEVQAPPTIDSVWAQDVQANEADLFAEIDPHGGASEYEFQYGTSSCVGEPSPCTGRSAGSIAAGYGDAQVKADVQGLQADTTYYYRVVAHNSKGSGQSAQSTETLFTTLPSAEGLLADARQWEMVSPVEHHGGAIEEIENAWRGEFQASANGDAITWLSRGPIVGGLEGDRSFEAMSLLSTRGEKEWETQSLETPHPQGSGLYDPSPSEYRFFSADLSLSLVQPTEPPPNAGRIVLGEVEHPPLSPEASEKTLYVRDDPPLAPAPSERGVYEAAASERNREYLFPGYLPLVNAGNDTAGSVFGNGLEFLGATSDLSHVVFSSQAGLTSAAPGAAGLYMWEHEGPLRLLSVLPDGSPASDGAGAGEPSLGAGAGVDARNAISSDGTRVVWSEEGGEDAGLYLRDMQTGTTIKLSAAQGHEATEPGPSGETVTEPAAGEQEVHFQAASSDGSRVFFTDTARLSEESDQTPTGEESPADLYEFEITSHPGEALHGRLSDLTPVTSVASAGSADVLGVIPGVSEDGSERLFRGRRGARAGRHPGRMSA